MFSYNKNVNFPNIRIGNNKIYEISVIKFFGIHLDKKSNFVNHITEMSMKVAKSIEHLYKLDCSYRPNVLIGPISCCLPLFQWT